MAEMLPRGVAETAFAWVDAVLSGDGRAMWHMFDDNLRLVETQLWLWANRDHPTIADSSLDALASDLSQPISGHPLWPGLLEARLSTAKEQFPSAWNDSWGPLSGRRVVGDGLEVAFFTDRARIPGGVVKEESLATGMVLLLRGHPRDGYQVAAQQMYSPSIPGWPPMSGEPVDIIDR